MSEFKPGDRVEIGHSDLYGYIVRRPTDEEFPRMLEEYKTRYDKLAGGFIHQNISWVIRIPVQEEYPEETIDLEEETVLWKRHSL